MLGRLRHMNGTFRVSFAAIVLTLTCAACTSAGGLAMPPGTPSSGDTGGGSVGSGGASGGDATGDPGTGSGVVEPPGGSLPGRLPPGDPHATVVVPKPGRLDVHPVGATGIEATVTGRSVKVRLSWWSGVAPCSVLDSVGVTKTGSEVRLTILEGADKRGIVCIEIAMFKATVVDLGELAPGTYTVSADGPAPPTQVVVH